MLSFPQSGGGCTGHTPASACVPLAKIPELLSRQGLTPVERSFSLCCSVVCSEDLLAVFSSSLRQDHSQRACRRDVASLQWPLSFSDDGTRLALRQRQ